MVKNQNRSLEDLNRYFNFNRDLFLKIQDKDKFTLGELRKHHGIPERYARFYIDALQEGGILKAITKGRAPEYEYLPDVEPNIKQVKQIVALADSKKKKFDKSQNDKRRSRQVVVKQEPIQKAVQKPQQQKEVVVNQPLKTEHLQKAKSKTEKPVEVVKEIQDVPEKVIEKKVAQPLEQQVITLKISKKALVFLGVAIAGIALFVAGYFLGKIL